MAVRHESNHYRSLLHIVVNSGLVVNCLFLSDAEGSIIYQEVTSVGIWHTDVHDQLLKFNQFSASVKCKQSHSYLPSRSRLFIKKQNT